MSDSWGWTGQGGAPDRGRNSSLLRGRLILAAFGIVLLVLLIHKGSISENTIIYFLVLVPSVILHEVSHGAVAYLFGDDTAKRAGRLTINPLKHIDPLGTVILPIILLLSGGTAFGYAKPVPVTPSRLRNSRNTGVLVSLAGPATNFLLFLMCALSWRYLVHATGPIFFGTNLVPIRYDILFDGGIVNILLMIFNLIPLPPLDGSVLLERMLPASSLQGYMRVRPYGMIIVLVFGLFLWHTAPIQNGFEHIWASLWNTFGGTDFPA